jgi:predicted heme/steroid binding protein
VFTLAELAKYNGQNGAASYIAVDGIVYDVSAYFRNGNHHGYSAGQDLTDAFYDEHSISILRDCEVIGTLEGN